MVSIGSCHNQAAIFIYKSDSTVSRAWEIVNTTFAQEGPIRGEWHQSRGQFLNALKSWNETIGDPSNAFLCIYAHAGKSGIVPCRDGQSERVTWDQLAHALPRGVQYLWLVGCKTEQCLKAWSPMHVPVKHRLLATTEPKRFVELVSCFRDEISLSNIAFDDEMLDRIRKHQPVLAKCTMYFQPGFEAIPHKERSHQKQGRS
jgi:hypothetical protein